MDEFRPQGTTMNSYAKIEQRLYDDFIRFGYSSEVAQAIAHAFTKYILGYFDDRQAFDWLVRSGADEDIADAVVESFRQAKQKKSSSAVPREKSFAGEMRAR